MPRRRVAPGPWPAALVGAAMLVLLLALPRPAAAQPIDVPPADGGAWTDGVELEAKQAAHALFARGNVELTAGKHAAAIALYREALTHWDHPAIHYNLALALIHTDDPVALQAALEKARAYGATPLGDERFARAGDYLLLVDTMVAPVEITLAARGTLLFDDKEVLSGPGTWKAVVRAGCHEVRGQAAGYETTVVDTCIRGGQPFALTVKLYTPNPHDGFFYRKPLPRWVGYTVFGFGMMTSAAGAVAHRADHDRPAFALYGVGGTLLATGVAIILLERPHYRRIALSPAFAPDSIGLAAAGRF